MGIELKPGDYVLTADIESEADELAITEVFRRAGCNMQNYDEYSMGHADFFGHGNVGWSMTGVFAGGIAESNRRRRLAPAQILGDEPPAWDGGLPPVGTEALSNDGVVLIKGYFGSQVWYQTQGGEEIVTTLVKDSFRPIRSEEDRAVDAMLSVVECSEGHYTLCGPMADAMRELYRAGLRFPKEAT